MNAKINVEKVLKIDTKREQHDARIEPQINDFSYFLIKGRNCKISAKSIMRNMVQAMPKGVKNRSKNDAGKKHAKYMEM